MKSFDREKFSHYVRYFFCMLAAQLTVFVIRVTFFNTTMAQAAYDSAYNGNQIARIWGIILSVVGLTAFCIIYSLTQSRSTENRRLFLKEHKEKGLGFKALATLCWRKNLVHTVMFAVFQLPFLIFYSFFGLVYVDQTPFEDFYALQSGFYEITKIGILGILMFSAYFFAIQMLFEVKVYRDWIKSGI